MKLKTFYQFLKICLAKAGKVTAISPSAKSLQFMSVLGIASFMFLVAVGQESYNIAIIE